MPAPSLAELAIADEPAAWAALGFAVADGACRVGGVRLRLAGEDAGKGIVGWALRDLANTDLDGLPTTRAEDSPAGSRPAAAATRGGGAPRARRPPRARDVGEEAHPNGVTAIDHVVAVSPALDRTIAVLRAAGLDLRRVREEPTPAGAPRQAFFRLGAEILEVIQEPPEV